MPSYRIGHGYDLHRLEPVSPAGQGRPMMLAGVRLEHDRGPVAHSDGDVVYHAVTDALLGAMAGPDIGQIFPDDDPRHESQDSRVFIEEAARRVRAAGYRVNNVDVTVILEQPRIAAAKSQMRANLAASLAVPLTRVNVKGKSNEGLGPIGEGRAVAAHVVVLISRA